MNRKLIHSIVVPCALVALPLVGCGNSSNGSNGGAGAGSSFGGQNSTIGGAGPTYSNGGQGAGGETFAITVAQGEALPISSESLSNILSSGGCIALQYTLEPAGTASPCAFPVPAVPSLSLEVPLFNFVYTVKDADGATQSWLLGSSTSSCPTGIGWYLDAATMLVTLCSETCSVVSADSSATVDWWYGCPTGSLR